MKPTSAVKVGNDTKSIGNLKLVWHEIISSVLVICVLLCLTYKIGSMLNDWRRNGLRCTSGQIRWRYKTKSILYWIFTKMLPNIGYSAAPWAASVFNLLSFVSHLRDPPKIWPTSIWFLNLPNFQEMCLWKLNLVIVFWCCGCVVDIVQIRLKHTWYIYIYIYFFFFLHTIQIYIVNILY